ncbi:hypothetical protein BvCmsKKP036_04984 [Escherichia coli]|nr:hypothetical protein BvCmsKKP036_04984 [Escherichia coli]
MVVVAIHAAVVLTGADVNLVMRGIVDTAEIADLAGV